MSVDFLDCIRKTIDLTTPLPVTSTIRCDQEGCAAAITVSHDIDEAQSMAIARDAGWTARLGKARSYHWCQRHGQVKR